MTTGAKPKTLDGLKFVEYFAGLQLQFTPSRQIADVLFNAYDSLSDLVKYQDQKSKSYKRFYEGVAEIIYPAVKQEEKEVKGFNELMHGDKGFFEHAKSTIVKKKEDPKKYNKPHTYYVGDRLRTLSFRKRRDLEEMLSLWNNHGDRYQFPPLQGTIQYLGEIYFLLNYCVKRDGFFEHINVSRKEEFIQKLVSIGKTLIQDFNRLEAQERIVRERMEKTVDKQPPVLDSTSESSRGTTYHLVTMDDLLEALIINLPYHMADNIELEDVEFASGQRYFISKVHPQMLTFQSDEGNYFVAVIVKDINHSYHVFSVHEDELVPEVILETFESTSAFTTFFSQLINQYELPSEENDVSNETDGVMISTINDVLKVLERLID